MSIPRPRSRAFINNFLNFSRHDLKFSSILLRFAYSTLRRLFTLPNRHRAVAVPVTVLVAVPVVVPLMMLVVVMMPVMMAILISFLKQHIVFGFIDSYSVRIEICIPEIVINNLIINWIDKWIYFLPTNWVAI